MKNREKTQMCPFAGEFEKDKRKQKRVHIVNNQ